MMPPPAIPRVSSQADSGGIRISTMLPCTLEITRVEEVLAKAFWAMAIMISPGARKTGKAMPATERPAPPSARVKMARNSKVVTMGAIKVWVKTLRNRRTSFR